jgi:hypothetical protein
VGEAACGSTPYPLFWFDFSINLLMIIAILGDARAAGAEAQCAGAPRSDCLYHSRISTEPILNQLLAFEKRKNPAVRIKWYVKA